MAEKDGIKAIDHSIVYPSAQDDLRPHSLRVPEVVIPDKNYLKTHEEFDAYWEPLKKFMHANRQVTRSQSELIERPTSQSASVSSHWPHFSDEPSSFCPTIRRENIFGRCRAEINYLFGFLKKMWHSVLRLWGKLKRLNSRTDEGRSLARPRTDTSQAIQTARGKPLPLYKNQKWRLSNVINFMSRALLHQGSFHQPLDPITRFVFLRFFKSFHTFNFPQHPHSPIPTESPLQHGITGHSLGAGSFSSLSLDRNVQSYWLSLVAGMEEPNNLTPKKFYKKTFPVEPIVESPRKFGDMKESALTVLPEVPSALAGKFITEDRDASRLSNQPQEGTPLDPSHSLDSKNSDHSEIGAPKQLGGSKPSPQKPQESSKDAAQPTEIADTARKFASQSEVLVLKKLEESSSSSQKLEENSKDSAQSTELAGTAPNSAGRPDILAPKKLEESASSSQKIKEESKNLAQPTEIANKARHSSQPDNSMVTTLKEPAPSAQKLEQTSKDSIQPTEIAGTSHKDESNAKVSTEESSTFQPGLPYVDPTLRLLKVGALSEEYIIEAYGKSSVGTFEHFARLLQHKLYADRASNAVARYVGVSPGSLKTPPMSEQLGAVELLYWIASHGGDEAIKSLQFEKERGKMEATVSILLNAALQLLDSVKSPKKEAALSALQPQTATSLDEKAAQEDAQSHLSSDHVGSNALVLAGTDTSEPGSTQRAGSMLLPLASFPMYHRMLSRASSVPSLTSLVPTKNIESTLGSTVETPRGLPKMVHSASMAVIHPGTTSSRRAGKGVAAFATSRGDSNRWPFPVRHVVTTMHNFRDDAFKNVESHIRRTVSQVRGLKEPQYHP